MGDIIRKIMIFRQVLSFGASVISHLKSLRIMDKPHLEHHEPHVEHHERHTKHHDPRVEHHECSASTERHIMKTVDYEVIIVGAGIAGSAMAYALGKDGRKVLVIERYLNEPNRIVGELLQPGGCQKLIELGLDDCLEDIDAQKVLGYAFFKGGKCVKLDYELEKCQPDGAGRSFHHGRFVQRLRNKAASLSNVHLKQGQVTTTIEGGGTIKGVKYDTRSGQELSAYAPLTIVSDGCFSSLRNSLSKSKVTNHGHSVGLILENCEAPYPGYAHVVLGDESRFSIYPIGNGEYRCLIDIPGTKGPSISNGEMANFLKTVVAKEVPPEFYSAFIEAVEEGQTRITLNSSMPAKPHYTPGALLLGDALNVRHPATGGGMTVALYDVATLRKLLRRVKNFEDTAPLGHAVEQFYIIRKPEAFKINICANGLYKVGALKQDKAREFLLQAVFDCLSLSSILRHAAIGLISGLSPSPWILVPIIFGMAIFCIVKLLFPFPTPTRVIKTAMVAWAGAEIFVHIWDEGIGKVFYHKFSKLKQKFCRKGIFNMYTHPETVKKM